MYTPFKLARRALLVLPIALALPAGAAASETATADALAASAVPTNTTTSNGTVATSWSAGTVSLPTRLPVSAVKIRARARGAAGESAWFNVLFDGNVIAGPIEALPGATVQTFNFPLPADGVAPSSPPSPANPHTVKIQFVGNGPNGEDRNLEITELTAVDTRPKLKWPAPTPGPTGTPVPAPAPANAPRPGSTVTITYPTTGVPDCAAAAPSCGSASWSAWSLDTTANATSRVLLKPQFDYKINLPATLRTGGVWLKGGRNVSIIGGALKTKPNTSGNCGGAIVIEPATPITTTTNAQGTVVPTGGDAVDRTVHIEGLTIDGSDCATYSDGINVVGNKTIVQVENTNVAGIHGHEVENEHGDALQVSAAKEVKVDRFSASTHFQGLFLRPDKSTITTTDLRHVDVTIESDAVKGLDALTFVNKPSQKSVLNGQQRAATTTTFANVFAARLLPNSAFDPGYWVFPWTTNPPAAQEPDPLESTFLATGNTNPNPTVLTYPGITAANTEPDASVSGPVNLFAPQYTYVKTGDAGATYTSPGYE